MHPPFRLDFDATIIEHLFGEMQGNFGKKQEKLENFLFRLRLDDGLVITDFGLEFGLFHEKTGLFEISLFWKIRI